MSNLKINNMEKLLLILLIPLFISCEKGLFDCNRKKPNYPHGKPDDISDYSSDGYKSYTYIYYCYNGKYLSYDYTSVDCGYWDESIYTSNGICK